MREISVSAMIHTAEDTRYDVHQQGRSGTYVIGIDAPTGTSGATLFFRTLAEFDRFERAVADGRDRFHATRDGLRNDPYGYDPDDEPDRAPSAAQEQAWNEQYDGTSFGA